MKTKKIPQRDELRCYGCYSKLTRKKIYYINNTGYLKIYCFKCGPEAIRQDEDNRKAWKRFTESVKRKGGKI